MAGNPERKMANKPKPTMDVPITEGQSAYLKDFDTRVNAAIYLDEWEELVKELEAEIDKTFAIEAKAFRETLEGRRDRLVRLIREHRINRPSAQVAPNSNIVAAVRRPYGL